MTERLRQLLGPRPALLIGFAALVAAVLATFAYVVLESQSREASLDAKSRLGAQERLGDEARVTADLTASIFTASSAEAPREATKTFGGQTVDEHALNVMVKRSQLGYALILGSDGKLLAASAGTPAAVRARSARALRHIREALEGRATLSGVMPGPAGQSRVLEWAMPFETPFGRRVQVQALSADPLFQFFSGYLGRNQRDEAGEGYVVDSLGRLVGASEKTEEAGDRLAPGLLAALGASRAGEYRDQGVTRYFTSAPVAGSTWRVVLSEPTSRLYPPGGSSGWLLFAVLGAVAVAGAASLLFLRRALVSGAQLSETNRKLAAVNVTLEERVAERTAAAEQRASELARSNAELEQFASITSHDLQEPLRKIRMFGDRLQAKLGDGLAEDAKADLERMQSAAQRMQRLINDLLDFSRVASRGQEFEPVDLREVAEEVLSDLEARVVELNARVDIGDLPVIDADRTQMRQLLQNLLGNALKFHREGEPPVVRIRGDSLAGQESRFPGETTAGDRCVITIEDNGIGFDEKFSERVFAAFERLHNRASYDGTGIGLSIARKIVWRHGGDITVKSSPEQGSTFTVILPLSHRNGSNGREEHPQ